MAQEAQARVREAAAMFDDVYCIKIKRYGCLGIEEPGGRLHMHAIERDEIDKWLHVTMTTLGPGDRAEITLTRGLQTEEAARAAREPVDPTPPGATQAGSANNDERSQRGHGRG